ncbi:MAG: TfoX/Sxy family DNA transformation protein [Candidatus Woesearchaeota archaeon]|nr:TfoX/Sxy family DNA transformation protein [Candidatus Woesearchaeota archaeon]
MRLEQMRNIGNVTAGWFALVGINDKEDVERMGVVAAYKKVKAKFPEKVSFNCLFALAAGLQDRDWRSLSEQEKTKLRRQAEGVEKI